MAEQSNQVSVLAVLDDLRKGLAANAISMPELDEARAAVAELVEADLEVDAIEDEVRRACLAGRRRHSYGTGWEARDAAAAKDRAQRLEAAHNRRAAALARVQGGAA